MSLASLAVSVVPALLAETYSIVFRLAPYPALDGLIYGLPQVLQVLIGGCGLALAIAARRPAGHLVATVAGIVLIPLVLLLGAGLFLAGLAHGAVQAMQTLELELVPLAAVLVLAGAVLLWLGGVTSTWSRYALVVPALLLILATFAVHTAPVRQLPGLWSSPTGSATLSFLSVGGGLAAAVVMLAHTVVLAVVHARARRRVEALSA